jgi:hypothetical protein
MLTNSLKKSDFFSDVLSVERLNFDFTGETALCSNEKFNFHQFFTSHYFI